MSMSRVITYDYLNFDRSEAGSSLSELLSVDSGVTYEESSTGSTPTPPAAGTQKRFQKKMCNDQVQIVLETFYNEARPIDSKVSINKFADCRSIPRGTFKGILNLSGLGKIFTTGALSTESSFVMQQKITKFIEQRSRNEVKRNNQNHNNFLTEDEQKILISYCTKLAIFGNCLNKQTLLGLANAIVNMSVDSRDIGSLVLWLS
eukprot:scaffold101131_cov34-Attheya_sp.AAC.1